MLVFSKLRKMFMFDTCYDNIGEVGSKNEADVPPTSCVPSSAIGGEGIDHWPFVYVLYESNKVGNFSTHVLEIFEHI